ncbi:alkylphosphonate utilization protein [Ahrensia sp. R2A130]|uniref:alkylphosphonate utilization protein n=1 Tax=Ahrensia sp. R2A130 TaxID=744979 RepID=UPI0001E0F885|nr:PhnA protein [Ahrensia sp. R2A130]
MTTCALCDAPDASPFKVEPDTVAVCDTCRAGLEDGASDDPHWQCLTGAIWSTEPAVQILAWRLLSDIDAPWASETLELAHLEPDVLARAQAGISVADNEQIIHRDSNGAVLEAGDTVTLIKDLPVKGAGFTAKRGTSVRGISLVADNADQIEGRVDGQRIVILCQYVKRAG